MQVAAGDLDYELAATHRMLERIPEEHFAWKPHEKSMSLGQLAAHMVNLLTWHQVTLERDVFDLADAPPGQLPESRAALLQQFDAQAAAVKEALAGTDEAALGDTWQLKHGEAVLMAQPRAAVLRTYCISHMVHHRGQLSVYLRLLDVPLPSVYGNTADEPGM